MTLQLQFMDVYYDVKMLEQCFVGWEVFIVIKKVTKIVIKKDMQKFANKP